MPGRKDLANAVRALAMDAVEKAKSGHPGAPMGMADMAEALWNDFMKHNPANPNWWNRDRFVLSNGHASMMLYAVLHLTGYDLDIEEIKNFRQMHSKTPGHPEHGLTPGVETTTGPLGQGIATAVGMALAEKMLSVRFNREGFPIVDHYTYAFMGEGCLMEGLSHEACSLAGTLGLGKLVALWDKNNISIDGPVTPWFSEDTAARFKAYGWHVIENVNGQDGEAVKKAIAKARKITDKPSLICCDTTIAFGSPNKSGTAASHGSPLGDDEISATRKIIGWKYPPFEIPSEVKTAWDARIKGENVEKKWNKLLKEYAKAYPAESAEFIRRMQGLLPEDWEKNLQKLLVETQNAGGKEATRNSSLAVLNVLVDDMPELLGGSADLSGSNGTRWKGAVTYSRENSAGNYLSYGVREFGMGAVMNGLALHGGFIPYGGTFLIFSDYAKNAIRLSALMKQRVIWVLTHDSIGVGEDGPTHQPIEQLAGLRFIPGLHVWRPADKIEAIAAWHSAIARKNGPSCLSMSRQDLPVLSRNESVFAKETQIPDNLIREHEKPVRTFSGIQRGGYIIKDCKGTPDIILIATGSEVSLAMDAANALAERKISARVVSMPCTELYDAQDAAWKESVLPSDVRARVAIEAAAADFWYKYTGLDGRIIGMRGFGESAPGKILFEHFGFTVDNVVKTVEKVLEV